MTYKTEIAHGDWEINMVINREEKNGYKPIFMTPLIITDNATGGGPISIKLYITFEKIDV